MDPIPTPPASQEPVTPAPIQSSEPLQQQSSGWPMHTVQPQTQQPITMTCPQCHQQVPVDAYFCPNCGKNLRELALSTTPFTQAWIYFFSLLLPVICYIAIGQWPAFKYVRSGDPKAKMIGYIAIGLLLFSTIVTIWYAGVWVNQLLQSQLGGAGVGSYSQYL